jgi:Asp-tRNA(Asn)/Glu-tRNA(Gln) amidotransferase A subunit family amidase
MFACLLLALGLACSIAFIHGVAPAQASTPLNLETLTGSEEEKLLEEGKVNSVELVKAYLARIAALNKAGPGLNAVTQLNPDAIEEAEAVDEEREEGKDLGPAMGLPILLKDIIDATPMYTSAGDWALRESYPEKDSGVAKDLRTAGVVILGKAGLSEWANSFGSQPSGFGNLTGQVLSAIDAAEGPSGSSSGSAASASASLSALTIGTETSGSIISPSTQQSDVGMRPTLGLVPGYGIAPIDVSQDTAGPIVKSVADAAITLQSIAEVPGTNPEAAEEDEEVMGSEFMENGDILPAPFTELPDYREALTTEWVKGKRIGYNGNTCTPEPCTPTANEEAVETAVKALEAAGAIMVPDAEPSTATLNAEINEHPLPSHYQEHATIDAYYKHLGPDAPVQSLVQEVEIDETNPQMALKFGNKEHAVEAQAEDTPGGANQQAFDAQLPERKRIYHAAIEKMMSEPSGGGGPVIGVVGAVPDGPQAGLPEIAIPMGYTTTQRRNIAVDFSGGAYDELNLLGMAYVVEQAAKLHKRPAEVDPSMYRCAHTEPAEPFASRGHCNPDYQSVMSMLGGKATVLPFSLETTSAKQLESMMLAGELTSEELVKAELYRIAVANADGPAIQAIRAINPEALKEAAESDARRAGGSSRGPLEGIPVLVDDSMDVKGLATSGGSIALDEEMPSEDATLVSKLRAVGAIVLADTNTTELGDMFGTNMPQGYSSLGGQVLLPADTNKTVGGSSGGSAAAVSAGIAPLAVGMETSTEAAQMIAPAGNAGLVALKPTVGLVSRAGVMPVARSQDSPGPIGQTVYDVASELGAIAGPDSKDPVTESQPSPLPDYTAGLSNIALSGKKLAIVSSTTAPFPAAVNAVEGLGATATAETPGSPTTAPSVVPYEFDKDIDGFLAGTTGGAKSLPEIIEYNEANAAEGLKFEQLGLTAAVTAAETTSEETYEEDLEEGREVDQEVIAKLLEPTLGTTYSAIMVPSGSTLVGIADRAGYPVLTVPAGYASENSSTGGDPIGVDFIGGPYSEATLLDYGYAFEQWTKVRESGPAYMHSSANPTFNGSPSQTNQSMWRCVPGSSFYEAFECNPGDLESSFCIDELQPSCTLGTEGGETGGSGGSGSGGSGSGGSGGSGSSGPGGSTGESPTTTKTLEVVAIKPGAGLISVKLRCPSGASDCGKVKLTAVVTEKLKVKVKKLVGTAARTTTIKKTVIVASLATSVAEGATKTARMKLDTAGLSLLSHSKHGLAVKLAITAGGKLVKSKKVTIKPEAKGHKG